MGRSPRELLKPPLAATTADRNAPVISGPDHLAAHQRMSNKCAEPLPDRRLQRMAQLVPPSPPFDVDQLPAVQAKEGDRVRAAAATGPPGERYDRDRRATAPELLPHSGTPHQLMSPGPEPSGLHLGGLTARRRRTPVTGQRFTGRAATLQPAAGDVQMRKRNGTSA